VSIFLSTKKYSNIIWNILKDVIPLTYDEKNRDSEDSGQASL
jgi:hypothetical protein